ncbi:flagellin N-terminal helical domain-containing protein [Mangrovihabitans endophyticus]|uniref:flagellin N-terminal helical domain-containing protein n=1 Tax=Mangrovihabitans endophyticus TaxID=1751298 RepID=UPI001E626EF2|nr:flagellin [Mangrovihabitans endophyticus]
MLNNLQRNIQRGEHLQEQLSSGKMLNRPSDSPTGTVSAMQLRTESRANEQYVRNADDGIGWLSSLDTALSGSLASVNRARDLTLQGLNMGSGSADSREALAVEVDNIRTSILGYANTKYLDRPIFGGTTTGDVAYDGAAAFVGDTNPTTRTVGANSKVRVDVSGPEAFGLGSSELFTVLQDISDALRAGDADALGTGLENLDNARDLLKNTLSGVGARYNRITQMKQSAQDRLLSVASQLSDVEDVDLPKTIMEMQLQQTSYQAALAASAKVIQPSLIDFLR